MSVTLLVFGLAIVVFGAVVLLRFADRPGATIKWMGFEVSSKGAGLPLIGLGIVCVVLAVRFDLWKEGNPATTFEPATPRRSEELVRPGLTGTCLTDFAASVPNRRVGQVEAGMSDVQLISSSEPQDAPFIIVLTDGGEVVGALRVRPYSGGHASNTLFKLEAVLDASCNEAEDLKNVSRGGDPRALVNWDTVRMRLGDRSYDLRIGGEGEIGVGHFRRVL